MPGNLLSIDNSFPAFSGKESTEQKINTILNYLYQLREQLRWALGNLDKENFNDAGLKEIGDTFSKPIYGRIEGVEGDVAELSLTADGLFTRISDAEGNISTLSQTASSLTSRITNAEGSISTLSQTASSLTSRITNAEGSISTLSQTASSLTSRITNAEGSISMLSQTVNGLQLSATSGETASIISLKSGGITLSSAVVSITGMVTFSALSGYGTTSINGANIMTGTITAAAIGANDQYGAINFNSPLNLINGGIIFDTWASIDLSGSSLVISAFSDIYLDAGAIYLECRNGFYVNGIRIA